MVLLLGNYQGIDLFLKFLRISTNICNENVELIKFKLYMALFSHYFYNMSVKLYLVI